MWLKPHVLFNVYIFRTSFFQIKRNLGNFFIRYFFKCRPRWLGKHKRIPVKNCFGIVFKLKDTVTAVGKNTFNFCNQKQLQETSYFFWFVTFESIVCKPVQLVCKDSSSQKEKNKTLTERQCYFKFIATFLLSYYKGSSSCQILAFFFLINSTQL